MMREPLTPADAVYCVFVSFVTLKTGGAIDWTWVQVATPLIVLVTFLVVNQAIGFFWWLHKKSNK